MITTLEEAKEQSLRRWRKILFDCPKITVMAHGSGQPCGFTYERCGFCDLYSWDCDRCPLFPKVCSNNRNYEQPGKESLYWRIVSKLKDGNNRGLQQMIQKMIREIEKVDTNA